MNQLPKFQDQYNKIIEAYFKDEIRPFDTKFCFCGTLSPDSEWAYQNKNNMRKYPYRMSEYGRMERALFSKIPDVVYDGIADVVYDLCDVEANPNYEQNLFEGMCAAIEVLKQIHIEHGEVIEEINPAFTKRNLVTTP